MDQGVPNLPLDCDIYIYNITGLVMSCISHTFYINLPVKLPLADARMLAIPFAMGHNLQPVGITNCEITIGDTSMILSFIIWKYLTKELLV